MYYCLNKKILTFWVIAYMSVYVGVELTFHRNSPLLLGPAPVTPTDPVEP